MGLDMYLYKKHYVKNWDHMTPDERHTVLVKKGEKETTIKPERISEITEEVAYWRKANQIHKWFVDNVQDGDDECQEAYVTRTKLKELREVCKKVLESTPLIDGKVKNGWQMNEFGSWTPIIENGKVMVSTEVAQQLLPPQSGFFFGGTDFDQYYYEDVKYTLEKLDEILAEPEDGASFYYESSW